MKPRLSLVEVYAEIQYECEDPRNGGRSRTNRGFALKSRELRPAGCGVWERVDDVSTVSKIK